MTGQAAAQYADLASALSFVLSGIGILLSLLIATVLYIAVSLVLTGIVPYQKLGVPDPIAVGVDAAGVSLNWLKPLAKQFLRT